MIFALVSSFFRILSSLSPVLAFMLGASSESEEGGQGGSWSCRGGRWRRETSSPATESATAVPTLSKSWGKSLASPPLGPPPPLPPRPLLVLQPPGLCI